LDFTLLSREVVHYYGYRSGSIDDDYSQVVGTLMGSRTSI